MLYDTRKHIWQIDDHNLPSTAQEIMKMYKYLLFWFERKKRQKQYQAIYSKTMAFNDWLRKEKSK